MWATGRKINLDYFCSRNAIRLRWFLDYDDDAGGGKGEGFHGGLQRDVRLG